MPPPPPPPGESGKHHSLLLPGRSASGAGSTDNAADSELISPSSLRRLVLNYLVHHCYVGTAIAFAQDGVSSGSGSCGYPPITASGSSMGTARALASLSAPGLSSNKAGTNGFVANGRGQNVAANGNATSSRRGANGSLHPLSAPPLIREDSAMETKAETATNSREDEEMTTKGSVTGNEDDDDAHMSDANGSAQPASRRATGSEKGKFSEAKENFRVRGSAGETDLPPEEIFAVLLRREVRDHILAGRIRAAVDCCNTHFPGVLASSTKSASSRPGKEADGAEAENRSLLVPTDRSKYRSSSSHDARKSSASKENGSSTRLLPANPTSLDPAHLSLNLQIQEFIESVRAANSANSAQQREQQHQQQQGAASSPLAEQHPTHPGLMTAATVSRAASPAPSSASSAGSAASGAGSAASNAVYHAALSYIQSLHATCMELTNPYSRAMYMKEIESVSVLLAYRDLEKSPVRKYLDQRRRMALAEQINSAILFHSGHPSQPLIESAARQNTFVWSQLHADKVAIPLQLSSSSSSGSGTGGSALSGASLLHGNGLRTYDCTDERTGEKGAKSVKSPSVRLSAPWDLRTFLAER
ncbi:hypothetical protein K437DRAFT_256687 [Tilletiaria anomala UBC 951]|uniref:CRA domain-containing protein n=1 Tax=Tilletiaria anomala (strain ATCC 24038 / CBS 436.72 / UBC 951) TaxID=1037660 RepID=A0A066VU37_TILAU|nr:uncharacterized protein K437DRAFT_256687 [Tilletiaria anomala UBC 951]KDN45237.1 hypothetical protein K437DRAFT_256687 [Tilletiaria anomala UBC 951]